MGRKNISVITNVAVARVDFDDSLRGGETVVVWTAAGPTRGEADGRESSRDVFNNSANGLPPIAEDRSNAGKLVKRFGISSGSCWPSSSLPLTSGATIRSTGSDM